MYVITLGLLLVILHRWLYCMRIIDVREGEGQGASTQIILENINIRDYVTSYCDCDGSKCAILISYPVHFDDEMIIHFSFFFLRPLFSRPQNIESGMIVGQEPTPPLSSPWCVQDDSINKIFRIENRGYNDLIVLGILLSVQTMFQVYCVECRYLLDYVTYVCYPHRGVAFDVKCRQNWW